MTIITLGSSKGGVGKTTTTIILGTELARMGHNVTLIDCDKLNHSLERWHERAPVPDNLKFIGNASEAEMLRLIKSHKKTDGFLIVDLPGVASQLTGTALARSDLFLVPMADSSIDALVGANALDLVVNEQERLGKLIKHAVVLTMTSHIMSKEEGRIRDSLNENNIHIIYPPLGRRAAFSALFFHGGTLHDKADGDDCMAKENGLPAAKTNAETFVRAVLTFLQKGASHD